MRRRKFQIRGTILGADQWASLMMVAALGLALLWVNSLLVPFYDLFHRLPVSISFGEYSLQKPLVFWVNEGLMVLFFLAVTTEIKRELLEGRLSTPKQMLFPAFAALGGMIVPAAIYFVINRGDAVALQGWAIPTATDIALSLGVLSLFGKRVPIELKVFLAALAIFDDLGGILIIAVFYGSHLTWSVMAFVLVAVAALVLLNRFSVTHASFYVAIGLCLWAALQQSGIHPTMAGVAVGATLPLRVKKPGAYIPLKLVEEGLHPWTAFFIVPLFAFFNAGIVFSDVTLTKLVSPLSLGIIVGLFIGKPLGIFLFAWMAHALKFASLTDHVNWRQIFGVALLGGVGFTMALFFNALAYPHNGNPEIGRVAILAGSFLSAVCGGLWLHLSLPKGSVEP